MINPVASFFFVSVVRLDTKLYYITIRYLSVGSRKSVSKLLKIIRLQSLHSIRLNKTVQICTYIHFIFVIYLNSAESKKNGPPLKYSLPNMKEST